MKNSFDRMTFINNRNRIVGSLILVSASVALVTQLDGGMPIPFIILIVGMLTSVGSFIIYSSVKKKYQITAMNISALGLTMGGLAGIPDWESFVPLIISLVLVSLYENWRVVLLNIVISLLLFFTYFERYVVLQDSRELLVFIGTYFLISLILLSNTIASERVRTNANIEHNELKQSRSEIEKMLKIAKDGEEKLAKRSNELQQTLETLKQTQNQLVESEKMSALGNLVAGVAHEINTPLGIGVTATSHLDQKTKDFVKVFNENQMKKKDLASYIKTVGETTEMLKVNLERASELIKSFKQVAVDQSSEVKREIKMKEYMEEILLSLKHSTNKSNVSINLACPEQLHISTYPGDISQVFTNLILNSMLHAFDKGKSGQISISVIEENNKLRLLFQDDGKGMTKETIEKLFDPFYTTNRSGGGTGLGLHIVYNIVTQRLGGMIFCESKLGEGTRYTIELPVERGEAA